MSGNDSLSNVIVRKVQRLGASSLTITIPKEWAKRHGIGVGDSVLVLDDGDKLIILADNDDALNTFYYSARHSKLIKHIGKLNLCNYIGGARRIVIEPLRPSITREIIERIGRTFKYAPSVYIVKGSDGTIVLDMNEKSEDPLDLIQAYNNLMSDLFSAVTRILRDGEGDVGDDLYESLIRLSYKIVRSTNTNKIRIASNEVVANQLMVISVLLGVLAEKLYLFAKTVSQLRSRLRSDEVERLLLLTQMLEVATVTALSSLSQTSVKKIEESYWKIQSIKELENSLNDILNSASNAFTFLVAQILDITTVLYMTENMMLCYTINNKYAENNKTLH